MSLAGGGNVSLIGSMREGSCRRDSGDSGCLVGNVSTDSELRMVVASSLLYGVISHL
jgi:hypothetical protein